MGPEVNTKAYHEMSPVVSTDGKKLYFVENNRPENAYGTDNSQDIWFSNLDEKGSWSQAKRLGAPLNQNRYNTVFNVLPDGSLFVRGGSGKNDKGVSIVSPSGRWNELPIKDFAKMDKGQFNGATISSDLKHVIMYFSEVAGSARSDLYISNQQPDGSWPRPIKLPMSTGGDEFGPFIGPDQNSLYFASDRIVPGRIGNVDIYKVTRLDDTWMKWSTPVNLGKGVNTIGGDAYFSLDAQGNVFTCRMGSLVDGGNYDIYLLKPRDLKITLSVTVLNEKTQQPLAANVELKMKDQKPLTLKTSAAGKVETRIPEIDSYNLSTSVSGFSPKAENFKLPRLNNDTTLRVVLNLTPIAPPVVKKLLIKGTVFDKKTQLPVTAKVDIVAKPDRSANLSVSAESGIYEQELPSLGEYVLTASTAGYLNSTDSVNVINADESPVTKDLFLSPIEVGTVVRLKNIYFDFDKTTLKAESFVELNKVVDFLTLNGKVEIEIEGHTDNKGSDEYNQNLSQGRSQSVVDYLVQQGIESNRLTAHGFGESKPIDTNDTDEGRANNRRVEFTVLKK
jgi:outer membrane protein OmpA-like peptidoglycan-associated protein